MDKDNLSINLQDWLNDPMLAAQLNRTQSSTPALFNEVDEHSNSGLNGGSNRNVVQLNQATKYRPSQHQAEAQQQRVDYTSTSDLSNLLSNSRLNLGTLVKFVCIEFFKCNKDELTNLRLIDLTQDSAFPQTLTLRNMQTENSHYKFFNTINRDKSISNCPIFAIALYSFLTWKQTIISWKNFMNLPLIFDSKDIIMLQGNGHGRVPVYTNKMVRSLITPKKELQPFVFCWLADLEKDYLTHDRSNYILFSLVELFQFLAKVLLQDFAFLQCTGQLPHLQELIKSEFSWQFLESDLWNSFKDEMQKQIDDELVQVNMFNSICNKMELRFLKISKELLSENDKLSKELEYVKNQLSNMSTLMDQVYQNQKQLLSQNINPNNHSFRATNINAAPSDTNAIPHVDGPVPIDKSNLNSSGMTTLFSNSINGRATPQSSLHQYNINQSILNDRRSLYGQQYNSLKRMKLDAKNSSNFDKSSRRLSQPQPPPQSPLQIGSPLESFLSKPITSPKITVSMLNNSTTSPPPNPLGMSPLPAISSHLAESLPNETANLHEHDDEENNPHGVDESGFNSEVQGLEKPGQLKPAENEAYMNGVKSIAKPKKAGKPNRDIKYKLSRDNKTIWDLYNEWYHGLNGKLSIKELIERYGFRRWKVTEDSHFFPTRRIIIDYIEREIERSLELERFSPDDPITNDKELLRKHIVKNLESFREENGLTLNSLSLYFRNLTRWGKEICIYDNFDNWSVIRMNEEDKVKYCKRQPNSNKDSKDGVPSPEESE